MAKKKPTEPAVVVTQSDIEKALEAANSPELKRAFNPAEFARKAAAIAKLAAPVVALIATTNWKNPMAAATALVKLYDLFTGSTTDPAAA